MQPALAIFYNFTSLGKERVLRIFICAEIILHSIRYNFQLSICRPLVDNRVRVCGIYWCVLDDYRPEELKCEKTRKLVGKKRQVRRPSITSFADNNVRAKSSVMHRNLAVRVGPDLGRYGPEECVCTDVTFAGLYLTALLRVLP